MILGFLLDSCHEEIEFLLLLVPSELESSQIWGSRIESHVLPQNPTSIGPRFHFSWSDLDRLMTYPMYHSQAIRYIRSCIDQDMKSEITLINSTVDMTPNWSEFWKNAFSWESVCDVQSLDRAN